MTRMQSAEVAITVRDATLHGTLTLPDLAKGIVAFAHGSGSSRFSRRNQRVAQFLNQALLGTLLFDLLTQDENSVDAFTSEFRFDIPLLARRLTDAIDWLDIQAQTQAVAIGLFGASTGAAAALIAAADRPRRVSAVVSRGGRPDLAGEALSRVLAPTLFIVGGWDTEVVALNEQAAKKLLCERRTIIIPEATHLFEEPGKLDEVSRLAAAWFGRHLRAANG